MSDAKLHAGMPVECAGRQVGTLARVRGQGADQVLEIAPAADGGDRPAWTVSGAQVARVQGNRVVLTDECAALLREAAPGAAPKVADLAPGERARVPVVAETLNPVTQWREAGALSVYKTIRTEERQIDVPLRYEEVALEHVPINRELKDDERPAPRQEGDSWIVPVIREEPVVATRRILVEELRLTRRVATRHEHLSVPVRQEEVAVRHPGLEQVGPQAGSAEPSA